MTRPAFRGFRGDRLRDLRLARGWTQERLAGTLGVYESMVGRWERGEVVPDQGNVHTILGTFGVSGSELTDVDPDEATPTDLRVWRGLTRSEAAGRAGLSQRRLLAIEHLTRRPTEAEAEALDLVYGCGAGDVLRSWEARRAEEYPAPSGVAV